MKLVKIVTLGLYLCFASLSATYSVVTENEITFVNAGQGHATLVRKPDRTPLLVDAGSKGNPYHPTENYAWDRKSPSWADNIADEIWDGYSPDQKLRPTLNVIVTHPDEDHVGSIDRILTKLDSYINPRIGTTLGQRELDVFFLLGGSLNLYQNKRCLPIKASIGNRVFSRDLRQQVAIASGGDKDAQIVRLTQSHCIRHLYCPVGIPTDDNTWSIVAGIAFNPTEDGLLDAVLTGDKTIGHLPTPEGIRWRTRMFLCPHHGGPDILTAAGAQQVRPHSIIVGAGLRGRPYYHPRASTLCIALAGMPGPHTPVRTHGIAYYQDGLPVLQARIGTAGYSCELVDSAARNTWKLGWTTAPIYTLWATGSLRFVADNVEPEFLDAPTGMLHSLAVSSPFDYFSPTLRPILERLLASENFRAQVEAIPDSSDEESDSEEEEEEEEEGGAAGGVPSGNESSNNESTSGESSGDDSSK